MDDEAPAIASIRRLRELELHNAPEFGPDGLAHLTELYQLTRLLLRGIGHRRCLGCEMISDSRVGAALAAGCRTACAKLGWRCRTFTWLLWGMARRAEATGLPRI